VKFHPIAWFCLLVGSAAGQDPVEPSDLAKRPDLVGHEVVVDDRIRYFLQSKPRQGYDELLLKRTEVLFKLPPRLKMARSPSEPNARVRGVLKVDDGRLICEVETLELLPNDSDRLDRELGRLRPDDLEAKRSWAIWAERRGQELNDPRLEARGTALESETLWAESERPQADPLALAERAQGRPIALALRNALFHKGFRSMLGKTSRPAELDDLAKRVEATLPDSSRMEAAASGGPELLEAYGRDPASTYRDAAEPSRVGLDRRLLADVIQKSLEKQLEVRPTEAMALADLARSRLPDRPAVAERLRQSGLKESEKNVASLRQSEVEELARTIRAQGEEARANRLLRSWLDDRRKHRLSGTDSEGRVILAGNYDRMLGDKAIAAELLREALTIDPESRPVSDAFLRMGFRKGDAGWFDPNAGRDGAGSPASDRPADQGDLGPRGTSDPLKGLTRAQVRSRLGSKPDQIIRNASQGRCLEQWIYRSGKAIQVINFVIEPGTFEPRVTSYYVD